MCGKPYRGFESHSLRHYTVLLCIRLFELTGKQRVARRRLLRLVPRCYPQSPRKPWVLAVGSEDGFREGEHMAGKLKPLDVERETRPGKYPDGDGLYLVVGSATSKNWNYRYWKDGKQRWLGLGSLKDVRSRMRGSLVMRRDFALRAIAAYLASTSCRRSERRARSESRRDQGHPAPFEQCAETYIREHWSTWSKKHRINGRRRSNATPTRLSENSRSRRSSRATSTNCSGRSGLRSERRPIVSADGSKRSSRRTSTLTTPIFEIPPNSPNSCARNFQGGRSALCGIILRYPTPKHRSSWLTCPRQAASRLRCSAF